MVDPDSFEFEVLAPDVPPSRVAEGPFWDARTDSIGWVDILAGLLHLRADDGTVATHTVPTLLGAAIPQGDGFLLAVKEGFAELTADGDYRVLDAFLPEDERMNDAKADPAGRVWAGSCHMEFEPGRGALHRRDPAGTVERMHSGMTLPNGLDWSPDGTRMYLVDSMRHEILVVPFDVASPRGITGEPSVLVILDESLGLPDGMCVAADGTLWIAMWGGSRLLQLDAAGTVLREVPVPAQQPSSCAFVGVDGDALVVTTAGESLEVTTAHDGRVLRAQGGGALGLPVGAAR